MAIVEKVDGFFIPNVTLIGVGAAKAIPERIVYLNATKPLLVTDKGIVHTGTLKQITDILDEAAMEYSLFFILKFCAPVSLMDRLKVNLLKYTEVHVFHGRVQKRVAS